MAVKLVPDETIIKAPIGKPLDQPPVELSPDPVPAPVAEPSSFGERIAGVTEERVQNVQEASEAYEEGDISYPELALQGVGNAGGMFLDIVGETAMSALAGVTPDNWEDYLKEQIAAGGSAVMDTKLAKETLALWKATPQRVRDVVVASLDTAGVLVPPVGYGVKAGKKLVESAELSEKNQLSKHVLDQGPSAKASRAAELGMPEGQQRVANLEGKVLDTVLSLKGISGSSSPSKIMGAVNAEIISLNRKLRNGLAQIETVLPASAVNQKVTEAWLNLAKEKPIFAGKSMKPKVTKVFEAYRTAMKDFDGSATGLLEARRKFDDNVAKLFNKDVHAGDDAHREVVAEVRNKMNDLLEGMAPDDDVKALMGRQHRLLIAKNDLKVNLAREKGLGEKIAQWTQQHPIIMGSLLSGGGGMVGNVITGPLTGPALATAATAYGLSRPAARRGVGNVLQEAPLGRGLLYGASNTTQEEEQ